MKGGMMMDQAKIEELKKRLLEEREYAIQNASMKGEGKGQIDIFNFTFSEYIKFKGIFQKYVPTDPRPLSGIEGNEPEIKELYDSFRERYRERTIRVEIEKPEGEEDFQGAYNITFSEEVLPDPLDQIVENDQPKFLKGWISGILDVAKQLGTQELYLS